VVCFSWCRDNPFPSDFNNILLVLKLYMLWLDITPVINVCPYRRLLQGSALDRDSSPVHFSRDIFSHCTTNGTWRRAGKEPFVKHTWGSRSPEVLHAQLLLVPLATVRCPVARDLPPKLDQNIWEAVSHGFVSTFHVQLRDLADMCPSMDRDQ